MVALAPLPVIAFPAIDPVLIELGPFAIRWYALAYIASLLLGWRYVSRLARLPGAAPRKPAKAAVDGWRER